MRKLRENFERKPHYGIRKLTIGVASVVIGLSFLGYTSDVVKADSENTAETNQTAKDPESEAETASSDNDTQENAKKASEISPVEKKEETSKPTDSVARDKDKTTAPEKTENTLPVVTGTDNQNQITSAQELSESKDATSDNQKSELGKSPVNVDDWKYNTDTNQDINLTDYIGNDKVNIVIPNDQDFIKAGKLNEGHAVKISSKTMHNLIAGDKPESVIISKTNNGKVVAADSNWSNAFGGSDNDNNINRVSNNTPDKVSVTSGIALTDPNLTALDVTNLDTHNITNFSQMFYYGDKLTTVGDLSNWDVSNGKDFAQMFKNASALTTIGDLSNWDVSNGTDFTGMFNCAHHIKSLGNLSNWNVAKSRSFANMFREAWDLQDIGNISSWDVSNAKSTEWMFGNNGIKRIDISGWDLRNTTKFTNMFQGQGSIEVPNPDNGLWMPQPVHKDKIVIANDIKLPANANKIVKPNDFAGGSSHQFVITNNPVLLKLSVADISNTITIMQDKSVTLFTFVVPSFYQVDDMDHIEDAITNQLIGYLKYAINDYDSNKANDDGMLGYTASQLKKMVSPITQDLTISDNKQIGELTLRTQNSDGTFKDTSVPVIWNMNQVKQEEVQEVIAVLPNGDKKILNRQVIQYQRDINWDKLLIDGQIQFTDWQVVPGTLDHWKDLQYYDNNDPGTITEDQKKNTDFVNIDIPGYKFLPKETQPVEREKQVLDDENGPHKGNKPPKTFVDQYIYLSYIAKKYKATFKFVNDKTGQDYPRYQHSLVTNAKTPPIEETYDEQIVIPEDYADYESTLRQKTFSNYHLKLSYIEYEGRHYQPEDLTKLKYTATKDTEFIYHLVPDASVITYKDVTGLAEKDYDSRGVIITDSVMKNLNVDPNPKNGKWDNAKNGWDYQAANWTFVKSVSPDKVNLTVYLKAKDKSIKRVIKYVDGDGNEFLPDGNEFLPSENTSMTVNHTVGNFVNTDNGLSPEYNGDLSGGNIFQIPSTKEKDNQKYYFDVNSKYFTTGAEKDKTPIADNGITVDKLANTITVKVPENVKSGTTYIFVLPYVQSHINLIYKDVTGLSNDQYVSRAKNIEGHDKPIEYINRPNKSFENPNVWDYEKDGWELAFSDEIQFFPGADHKYSQDYVIYLKHGTEPVSKTVTETIEYQLADDTKLPGLTYENAVTLNGTKDKVTGDIIYDDQTLVAVTIPTKKGYTASVDNKPVNEIEKIKVDGNTTDIVKTVIYTPNVQHAMVEYIDDTENKVIAQSPILSGVTDGKINYSTDQTIKSLEAEGYELVQNSDETKTNPMIFDNDDNSDQFFRVHFVHQLVPVTPKDLHGVDASLVQKEVKEIVQYVGAGDKTPDDAVQNATWTRQLTKDRVTGQLIKNGKYDTAWTSNKINYDKVKSPIIEGFHPDPEIIFSMSVTQQDIKKIVTYLPNDQEIRGSKDIATSQTTKFVDENGKELSDAIVQNGNFHYSGDTYDKVTNKKIAKGSWDEESHAFNEVNAPLINGYVAEIKTVAGLTTTIKNPNVENKIIYHKIANIIPVDKNGKQIPNSSKVLYINDPDDPTKVKSDENTPKISGWHLQDSTKIVITPQDPTKDTYVVYIKEANGDIAYIDDDEKAKVLSSDKFTGDVDSEINYNPAAKIKDYQDKGYVLVNNNFKDNLKYKDDDNHFEVHFVHKLTAQSGNITRHRTIKYFDGETGESLEDKVKPVTQDVTFKNTALYDEIVKNVVGYNTSGDKDEHGQLKIDITDVNKSWLPENISSFAEIISPNLTKYGYKEIPSFELHKDNKDAEKVGELKADPAKDAGEVAVYYFHNSESVTDKTETEKTITETIHYVYANGGQANPDYTKSVTFTRTASKDLVTGHISYGKWNREKEEFGKVTSPTITGYTPDIKEIAKETVTPEGKNIAKTVTYNADAQKAEIKYIDDTDQKQLSTDSNSGKFGDKIKFTKDVNRQISNYESNGYKVVSNDFDNNNYEADNNKNVFEVHFVHNTKQVSRKDDVNMTVHYVMSDDSKAPSDNKQTVSFIENGVQDLVTNKVNWDKADAQEFVEVNSPEIIGYTPSVSKVDRTTVHFGDKDIALTVIYKANNENAVITYVDDATGHNLKQNEASGKFKANIAFDINPQDQIKIYEKQGYKLVSNDFNNNVYHEGKNEFFVHLTHNTELATRTDSVSRTVKYLYENGKQAQPDSIQTIHFTENGITDNVTKDTKWNAAESQKFNNITSPKLTGYTPDKENVLGETVKFGDKDIEVTVIYKADDQRIIVNYIDQDTSKTLQTKNLTGKTNANAQYSTQSVINSFEKDHYVLVSDDTNGKVLKFDNDTTKDQTYNVYLKHDHKSLKDHSEVNETIHYIYSDNSKAAADYKANTIKFDRNGDQDLVTGEITWNKWTKAQSFAGVKSPEVKGYTPNHLEVESKAVDHDSKDINIDVIYHANDQQADIKYVDDTTGEVLGNDSSTGKFDQAITFGKNVNDQIKDYQNAGYLLVSNNFKNQKFQSNNAKNQFEVHLKHATKNMERTNTVKEIIHYVFSNGSKVADDNIQNVNFEENGVQDLVTKAIEWKNAPTQSFNAVASPHVAGYTSDNENVAGKTVNFGDKDIEITVTYHANPQTAHFIFRDDDLKTDLEKQDMHGKTDENIDFTNAQNSFADYLLNRGFEFVNLSDETASRNNASDISDQILTTNKEEAKNYQSKFGNPYEQFFVIHLKHGVRDTKPGDKNKDGSDVVLTGEAKAIIHYVDEDGNKVADDSIQTIKFSRTGKTDAVTGQVIELNPWKADKPFASITSPEISGYTANKDEVLPATPMSPEEVAQEYTVVYTKNEQGSEEHHDGGDSGDDDQPDTPVDNPPSGDSDEFGNPSDWEKNTVEKDVYTKNDSKDVRKNKFTEYVEKDSRHAASNRDVIGKAEVETKEKTTNKPIAATVHNLDKKQTQAELPQTGEKQDKAGLIGLAFASIAGLLGLAGKRRKNK